MDDDRTIKYLVKKLLDNPFMPLLFINETIKVISIDGFGTTALKLFVLSVISIIVWVLSDAISVDVDRDKIVG